MVDEFDDYPAAMWGIAFFRAVTNKTLAVKVEKMKMQDCTEKWPCGIDWETASPTDYAEKCPKRRWAQKEKKQPKDCEFWNDCEVAITFRHVCEDSKDVGVFMPVHSKVTKQVDNMLGDDPEKIVEYARDMWTAIYGTKSPLKKMIKMYKKDVLGL